MTNKLLPILCAVVDGFITLAIFIVIAIIDGKTLAYLISERAGLLFFVLFAAAVVTWRGYADARRLIVDRRNWIRSLKEGFILGFLPAPILDGIGMLQNAFAADPSLLLPSLAYSTASDWLHYFSRLLIGSLILGVIGGIYATLLSLINRMILNIAGNKINTADR